MTDDHVPNTGLANDTDNYCQGNAAIKYDQRDLRLNDLEVIRFLNWIQTLPKPPGIVCNRFVFQQASCSVGISITVVDQFSGLSLNITDYGSW